MNFNFNVDVDAVLRPNDVLFGQGLPRHHQGNVDFTRLLQQRFAEYDMQDGSLSRNEIRRIVSRQVYQEITRRRGRFLRKCENNGTVVWREMTFDEIFMGFLQDVRAEGN